MENKVKIALDAIYKTRGEDVILYDFTSVNPFIDRVIICSASNMRQVHAMAVNIRDTFKEHKISVRMEGTQESRWILLDIDTLIVHVFLDEERDVYRLERLYNDLPRLDCHDL